MWIVGAGLAAFAGIYLGMTQNSIWNMGQRILLVLFAAVILGGLGTIYGAIVGALVVGVFINLTTLIIDRDEDRRCTLPHDHHFVGEASRLIGA